MIPKTANGYSPFDVVSAIQKCIRRGLEREAMLWCLEMAHSGKQPYSWMLNRLRVIAHEDIGIVNPQAVAFTMATCDALVSMYDKQGWRIMIGNVVRILCRSPKSREGDHFVWVTLDQWTNRGPGEIPDFAKDMHTRAGKQMGRGIEHFIEEGARLYNEARGDIYREEACDVKRAGDAQDAEDFDGQCEKRLFE